MDLSFDNQCIIQWEQFRLSASSTLYDISQGILNSSSWRIRWDFTSGVLKTRLKIFAEFLSGDMSVKQVNTPPPPLVCFSHVSSTVSLEHRIFYSDLTRIYWEHRLRSYWPGVHVTKIGTGWAELFSLPSPRFRLYPTAEGPLCMANHT